MRRKLPNPGRYYEQSVAAQTNNAIQQSIDDCHNKYQDVEIGQTSLILTAPNGGRWKIVVSNAGVLSASAV